MNTTTMLKDLLKGEEIVVAPGAYDGISAKIIEQAGFPVVYITGYGLEASVLGAPDVGMLSFGEILDRANKISSAVSLPTILDAEAGFGGPVQVARAVKEFEKAGVAAIHIEDQQMPKKCGSVASKSVIPMNEAAAKIKAAADARTDPDFLIIARTDADVVSIEEIIDRCNRYLEAGADMVFPVFVQLLRQRPPSYAAELYRRFAREVKGPAVWLFADWDPGISLKEIQAMGYKMAIFPVFTLLAATKAMKEAAEELKVSGTPLGYFKRNPGLFSVAEFLNFAGLPEVQEMENKYRCE
jgi:2-methylisocitrate lyase-like PEP mutase family enzyme